MKIFSHIHKINYQYKNINYNANQKRRKMLNIKKALAVWAVLLCLNSNNVIALEAGVQKNKYPDYGYEFVGNDKFEKFNRKVFTFNGGLNKCVLRPVHTVWASVMPQYGMDRIMSATNNIEYPIRLVSTLVQRDFKASGTETVRFLTNTTIGLGGLYDPAKKIFKIEPVQENMEQALAKCKVKQGPYLVIPILMSTSPRNIAGRILDAGLNPSSYIASPVLAAVKAGILVNRTSYMQPISKMIESTYADPYDIMKKLYGIENHIKTANLDRADVIEKTQKAFDENEIFHTEINEEEQNIVKVKNTVIEGSAQAQKVIIQPDDLKADMVLEDYNPQDPVTDSMRTALFDLPGINDSIWNELSLWNRCFAKRIRTGSVNIDPDKENYKYRYIMQKDKNSPVAIVYPSTGEGITSHHSVVLAKLFFDAGYSVIIQGSHFQWEFVKSMPDTYKPGIPSNDAEHLRMVTTQIIDSLQTKYKCKFQDNILIGTSFGALTSLFVAAKESQENTLNISKYIAINPPIELLYAMNSMDKNSEQWSENPSNLKERVALTAAKVIQIYNKKDEKNFKFESLPFSQEEAKLITGFIMHQKLSDLIFAIENSKSPDKKELYASIHNTNFQDYAKKYLLSDDMTLKSLAYDCSLYSISDYLKKAENFRIYHTLDDYLINKKQLRTLKNYTGKKTVIVSNGGHLGYLYRPEFIESLKKDITKSNALISENR